MPFLALVLHNDHYCNQYNADSQHCRHAKMLVEEDYSQNYGCKRLERHGNTVNLTTSESITVSADPVKLARVFNNILKNAIAYSFPNTPIDVLADSDSKEIWVSFTNSGKTIPPGKLESIFEKFYRLDEARSSNTGGAGLGLAIAKEIVTRHGGTIRAVSENNVTTFTVTLPR